VSYFDDRNGDTMTNTIITETARSSAVINLLLSLVQTVFFVLIYMLVAFMIAPLLTLIAVIVLSAVGFLTRVVLKSGYKIGDRVATANERIQGLVNAGMRGMREIKLFNMSDDLLSDYRGAHTNLTQTRVQLARNQSAISNFSQLLNAFSLFALVYLGIAYLQMSFAALGVFLFAMFRLSPQISSLNNSFYNLNGTLPHVIRSHELIDELAQNAEQFGGELAPKPVRSITMDQVCFRYDAEDTGSDIRDISLSAQRGETVALVGPSGAGKSTVISLLARLYEPNEGNICANGADIGQFELSSWYERVTVVPQHPFVFNETLRYNIAIGNPEASDQEIERVCEISQVSAFRDELPDGLDSNLGDDAVRLSGGQRQRVAIARALLTDADVLLLDEATSELDSPTEETIICGIEAMDRDYLTFLVGHFLSTVQNADRIYTIVDGELVGTGTHRELLENNSQYRKLYGSQTGAKSK
jgi:subfamily B ATP-binding cassette protein MsbA